MRKNFVFAFVFTAAILGATAAKAQPSGTNKGMPVKSFKIAVFAPLYLDSVFTGTTFRYGKAFPKFVLPGFDFVQGMQMALDSMDRAGVNIIAKVYDSKSTKRPVTSVLKSGELVNTDLILGSVKDREYFDLAYFAADKNIPFVSATYPNDGGIKKNPFLIIVNSTLRAHCEGIFSYLLSQHGTEKILFVRKPGVRGDMITQYFEELNKPDGKPILNLQYVNVENDDFSVMPSLLDSTKNTIVVGASINSVFATNLTETLASVYKQYKTTLFGMPNWDGLNLSSTKTKDYPVYFTTPFFNSKWQKETKDITAWYRGQFKSYPSDMVFKGYEATQYFVGVLLKHPVDFMNHLNDNNTSAFTQPLYKPQFSSANDIIPNYFENKKLYFMKTVNGTATKAW